MENAPVLDVMNSNVVTLKVQKTEIPSLTELAKADPDLKDMIKLIVEYDLRDKAVALLDKKLASRRK